MLCQKCNRDHMLKLVVECGEYDWYFYCCPACGYCYSQKGKVVQIKK